MFAHNSKIPKTIFFDLRIFLFLFLFTVSNAIQSQSIWGKQMGGTDGDIGSCTVSDNSGHIYTIGTFSNTSDFGGTVIASLGKGDVFVTRVNASTGNLEWVKRIGGPNEDNGSALVCDPAGNIYCTGKFSGVVVFGTSTLTSSGSADAFLTKLDPTTGIIVWAVKMGGTGSDGALSITTDGQGNIFTCGYMQGTSVFGTFTLSPVGTNLNIFLAKTDANNGNALWAKNYGSAGYSYGTSVSCDATGDVYMSGYFESDVIFATTTLSAVQYQDIFTSKHYASTGNVAWAQADGGAGNDNANAITVSSDGNVYTAGKFEGTCVFGTNTLTSAGSSDVFVCKRDATTGNLDWVQQFGASGYEQVNAITNDNNGHLFITGQFNGFVSFGNDLIGSLGGADAFIVKLEAPTGSAVWAQSVGGKNVDSGNSITLSSDGSLYCTGDFQSSMLLAETTVTAKGGNDIFILKINSLTVGLKENYQSQINVAIMPNPFQNELTITLTKVFENSYQLILTDISGKIILQTHVENSQEKLNLDYLPSGIYFLTIKEKNGLSAVKKIIKN